MNKAKLLKGFHQKYNGILDALEDFQDFLDSTEDEELSTYGNLLHKQTLDFLESNEYITVHEIQSFIEDEYE
jgi:hypothetical protein